MGAPARHLREERGLTGVLSEFGEITVEQAMHAGALACARETPLRDVAATMARFHIHAVVVSRHGLDDDEVWGIVSDRDVVNAVADGSLDDLTAGQAAKTPLIMLRKEDSLAHAAELMKSCNVSHVVVVTARGDHPLGVVSTLDVARAVALRRV